MQYVRISLAAPKEGHRDEVLALEDQLLTHFRSLDGFVEAYRLTSSHHVGRITVWESEARADRAAVLDRTLALRAQLLPLVDDTVEFTLDGERVGAG